jgi:site-specific DNA recombinase
LNVGIYIRVSTKLQGTKFSLSAQKEELTKYAQSQGWTVVGNYMDVDQGDKLDKEGLTQLLDDVDEGQIDLVLCVDQDRLSRLDMVGWEYLKSILRENGVKIAEPGRVVDLTNEDDEFISDIKNLIAKREKQAIKRRAIRGIRQRTREGKFWGRVPWEYNYDKNTETITINEKWSWVIPYIDGLYLNKKMSDLGIVAHLNTICTPPGGKPWNEGHINLRFKSKTFHGIMEKKFKNGEVIEVDMPDVIPPLRSKETYEKIQQERAKRYRVRKVENPNMLRGVRIFCGKCGRVMSMRTNGRKTKYHFYIRHSKERLANGSTCYFSVNTLRIEKNLIRVLKNILTGEEQAKQYIKFDYEESDLKAIEEKIQAFERLIKDAKSRLDKLLDLYLDGDFPKEKLKERQTVLEKEISTHNTQKQQMEAKRKAIQANLWNYEIVYHYLQLAERFDTWLSEAEKMDLVQRLFPTGTMYDDRLVLQGMLPGSLPLDVEVPIESIKKNRYD